MKKILIVEDQMLARKYLCSCIEKSTECEVASALTRADAALQRCGEGHIDLVVMDICTENDSDGLDAAEAIKKYYPRIKIVMVTSMLEGRFLDRARKIGADSFWYNLSDQEMETLRLLCEGKTNAEIAAKLHVAESSVRTYINRMLEKTGYTNRNRLMVAAVSKRLVVPSIQLDV